MTSVRLLGVCVAVGLLGGADMLGAQQAAPVRLSIADALRRADSASESIGIARAGVRGADGRLMQARSGWLPQLNGAVSYTGTIKSQFSGFEDSGDTTGIPGPENCLRFTPDPSLSVAERLEALERGLDCTANGSGGIDFSNLPFGRAHQWNFGLDASQTLFDPTLGPRIRGARAGRDMSLAALDASRALAVLDAAAAYYDAQLAERLLVIAESTFVQADRSFRETELARRVGNVAEFDLLRASVTRDNQRPVVILRRSQRDLAMLRLRQLLDLPAGQVVELVTPLGDTSTVALPDFVRAGSADTTVDDRAAVRQAQAMTDLAEATEAARRGSRLPSIRLSSAYSKITFPEDPFKWDQFLTDWSVSVRLSVPLFTGGRITGEVREAAAAAEQARLRERQVREGAALEVNEIADQLAAAAAAWDASRSTAEQAGRAYAIAEVRSREGLSTLTELSDARLQLEQAEANRAQAARDLQVARLRALLLRDLPLGAGRSTVGAF